MDYCLCSYCCSKVLRLHLLRFVVFVVGLGCPWVLSGHLDCSFSSLNYQIHNFMSFYWIQVLLESSYSLSADWSLVFLVLLMLIYFLPCKAWWNRVCLPGLKNDFFSDCYEVFLKRNVHYLASSGSKVTDCSWSEFMSDFDSLDGRVLVFGSGFFQ